MIIIGYGLVIMLNMNCFCHRTIIDLQGKPLQSFIIYHLFLSLTPLNPPCRGDYIVPLPFRKGVGVGGETYGLPHLSNLSPERRDYIDSP